MKRERAVLADALQKVRPGIAANVLLFVGAGVVFWLYDLPLEPFLYAFVILAALEIAFFLVFWMKERKKAENRERILKAIRTENELPPADTLAEKDYSGAIMQLKNELTALVNAYESARQDEIDYYTAWVHQIKTPITVMQMRLGEEDCEETRALEAELFRIGQYVDMVLAYIRLGAGTDLVVKEYPLDELIREAIRKFAALFVLKKLRLSYEGTDRRIITDKKWFSVILEQILSNAIKYTSSGCITIRIEGDILKIADTGIGIAPEDQPRIFEKGFTGENGRLDKRSSGLGLYLCKKAADLLQIPLAAESCVGRGSTFSLDLRGKESFSRS